MARGSCPAPGSGVVRAVGPDMNWSPGAADNIEADACPAADAGGTSLTVAETQEAAGTFEGAAMFAPADQSSGRRHMADEGPW